MAREAQDMAPGYSPPGLPQYTYTEQALHNSTSGLKTSEAQSFVILEKVQDDTPAPKQPKDCPQHGPSQTPHLDAQLAEPRAKAGLQALSTVLASAAQEGMCLECAMQAVTGTLSSLVQDFRAAKKNGHISKEEKRALKGEAKWLMKDMKHNVKRSWKRKP